MDIVYYSNPKSNNTHRFVEKLNQPAVRLPSSRRDETPLVTEPYILILPTYGGGNEAGTVPQPVVRFLNMPKNRSLIRGIIAAGNTNFGHSFCEAGTILSKRLNVPVLHQFEVFGFNSDVTAVESLLVDQSLIEMKK